jgi:hypothetical protein
MSGEVDAGHTPARARRRRVGLAASLWLVLGFILWNQVFDECVRVGGVDYLTRQALHEEGRGPFVRIDDIMIPAVQHGLRVASLWSGALAGLGLVLVAWAAHRQAR